MKNALDALIQWYETLTPDTLEYIQQIYTADAYFRDPFNEVRGMESIKAIMTHMFSALDQPRFVVEDRILEGHQAFITWQFLFSVKGRTMTINGSTHLRLAEDGRVSFHRDYWDAAGELYEKVPLLGWLARRLRKAFSSQSFQPQADFPRGTPS